MQLSLINFLGNPQNTSFAEQAQGETIDMLIRRHWTTNSAWASLVFFLFILPVLLIQSDKQLGTNLFQYPTTSILIAGFLLWYGTLILFALEKFLFWYFNVYIITNLHIVEINFPAILSRQIIEVGLDEIENVTTSVSGVSETFYNFGKVIIETASKDQALDLLDVSNPEAVVERIQTLINQRKGEVSA